VGQPKPQAFEIVIFEIGSAVGMEKLGYIYAHVTPSAIRAVLTKKVITTN
jgi:hypothetical protein